jgi:hypothetical protein
MAKFKLAVAKIAPKSKMDLKNPMAKPPAAKRGVGIKKKLSGFAALQQKLKAKGY